MEDTVTPYRVARYISLAAATLIVATMAGLVGYLKIRQRKQRREWEIPFRQVHLEEKIGEGFFGEVYRAYHYGFVAVKKLYAANPGPAERKALENEIRLLKSLHHSNVLTLLGVVTKPHLAIVMDWCHCSLFHRLHVAESGYDPINALRLAMRVADGMSYLHSRGVLHRDLKSGNILLIDSNGSTPKICDFGRSSLMSRNAKSVKTPVGSILWMAPEIINPRLCCGTSRYSVYSDVYAFGICLYELLTNTLPHAGYERDQIMYLVGAGSLRVDLRGLVAKALETEEVMTLCIACATSTNVTVGERPTFNEANMFLSNNSRVSYVAQFITAVQWKYSDPT